MQTQFKPNTLYCRNCTSELAELNLLLPKSKTEISKEYFCLLVEKMAKGKADTGDLKIVSPATAYLLKQAMLKHTNCGALPSNGLPATLREEQEEHNQSLDSSNANNMTSKLSIWAPKDRFGVLD